MKWRDIEEFNGAYQVSDDGQVRNATSGHVICQKYAGSTVKYLVVVLCNGSVNDRGDKPKYVRRYVHRLVAQAFVPNPHEKPEVNHIDSNPLNNAAENLEWVTHDENMKHAAKFGNMRNRRKKVVRDDGVVYESVTDAAKAMNCDISNMSKACRQGWRVSGHKVSFIGQESK